MRRGNYCLGGIDSSTSGGELVNEGEIDESEKQDRLGGSAKEGRR